MLHADGEACRLVESSKCVRAACVQEVVRAGMIKIARPDAYGAAYVGIGEQTMQTLERANDGPRVKIQLQKVGPFPTHQFVLTCHKSADLAAAAVAVEHQAVCAQVVETGVVEYHHHVDVALRCGFAAAVTALQT